MHRKTFIFWISIISYVTTIGTNAYIPPLCLSSLGIEGINGTMIKFIERNSIIPVKKSMNLRGNQFPKVNENGIAGIHIRVIQGEQVNASDNKMLGDYILNGKYDETINIEVIFEIIDHPYQTLYVDSIDDINGKDGIMIAEDQMTLSQEEIDEIVRADQRFAAKDPQWTETMQARNLLESSAIHCKNQLEDELKLCDAVIIETLFEACNDVMDWLDDNTDADRDDYKEKQQEFDDIVLPMLKDFCQDNPDLGEFDDDYYSDHEDL
eukprot:151345_1